MIRIAAFALGLLLSAPAAHAGPFDDLTDADRAVLGDEIRDYLLENPEVFLEIVSILEQRQEEAAASADIAALETNRARIFNDGYSFVAGNPEGDITIVEFIDYQCGYCKRAHPEVASLLSEDGNIRLVQKEFPILGPASEAAARAALAVLENEGGEVYSAFSDRLMSHEGPLNDGIIVAFARESGADTDKMIATATSEAVSQRILQNRALGQALGISGTPTFIVMDEFVRGYLPLAQMREMVEGKRAEM